MPAPPAIATVSGRPCWSRSGWRLYRIWSTDWFKHPEREAKRLLEAVEVARGVPGDEPEPERGVDELGQGEAQGPAEAFKSTVAAPRYKQAKVTIDAKWHGRLRDEPISQLVRLVEEIVRVEQPVHFDTVVRRLTEASDQAAGAKVKERIKAAWDAAARTESLKREGEFMWRTDLVMAPVRDRSKLLPPERSWAYVSPMELTSAIQQVALASFGLEIDEVPRAVARLLGLGRTPAEVQSTIRERIDAMIKDGSLTLQGTCIFAPEGTPSLLEESRKKVEPSTQPVQPVPTPVQAVPTPVQPLSTPVVAFAPKPVSPPPASRPTPAPPPPAGMLESRLDVCTSPARPYVVTVLPPQVAGADLLRSSPAELAPLILAVCREESPVYLEHLFRRIATAYGLDRVRLQVGVRLRLALEFLVERGEAVLRGDFIWLPGQGPDVTCRSRAALAPDERVSATIALEEIQSAILDVVKGRDVSEGALCLPVALSLGFEPADEEVTARIFMAVKAMLEAGVLSDVGGGLRQVGAPAFLTQRTRPSSGPGANSRLRHQMNPALAGSSMSATWRRVLVARMLLQTRRQPQSGTMTWPRPSRSFKTNGSAGRRWTVFVTSGDGQCLRSSRPSGIPAFVSS